MRKPEVPNIFSRTFILLVTEYLGLQGENCRNNFIIIANPLRDGKPLNVDRFCGSSFNTTTSMCTSMNYEMVIPTLNGAYGH